jgi:hypothetical protein
MKESESELFCTDSTVLDKMQKEREKITKEKNTET